MFSAAMPMLGEIRSVADVLLLGLMGVCCLTGFTPREAAAGVAVLVSLGLAAAGVSIYQAVTAAAMCFVGGFVLNVVVRGLLSMAGARGW